MGGRWKTTEPDIALLACAPPGSAPSPGASPVQARRTSLAAVSAFSAFLAAAALGACSSDADKQADLGKADNTKTEPKVLADQAIAEMDKLKFVQADGTGTDQAGKPVAAAMCADMATKAVTGVLTIGGQKLDVVASEGYQYMRAPGAVWAYLLGRADDARVVAAADKVAAGKYLKTRAESDDARIVDFFDGKTDTVTKGEVTDFNGRQAVPLHQTAADGEKRTYFVAAEGKPVILGKTEEQPGTREHHESTFEKVDSCDVQVPAADRTVDEETFDKAIQAAVQAALQG